MEANSLTHVRLLTLSSGDRERASSLTQVRLLTPLSTDRIKCVVKLELDY